jgi:hypothetical protein
MLVILAVLAAAAAPVAEPGPPATATVHFADGSRLPLADWVLSYEFLSGKAGTIPSTSARRESHELRLGGHAEPLGGCLLQIDYQPVEREQTNEAGDVTKEKVLRATGVTLIRGQKKSRLKLQAPDRGFLIGNDGAKSMNVLPRTLDLRGETLTGTKRELCLLSFSNLAECGTEDDGRVVEIELP